MLWHTDIMLVPVLAPKETLQDPVTLKNGETTLSDPQNIYKSFNKFFTNIASSLTHNLLIASDLAMDDKLQEFINCRTDASTSFDIPISKPGNNRKRVTWIGRCQCCRLGWYPTQSLVVTSLCHIPTTDLHLESINQNHHFS